MGGCFTSSHNLRWCRILNRKTRNQAEAREVSFFLDFQSKQCPLFFGGDWLVVVGMPGRLNRFYQGSSRAVTATLFWSSTWEKRWRELTRLFEDVFSSVELLQWHPKEAVLWTHQIINMQIESLDATSPTIYSGVIINQQLEAGMPPVVTASVDFV